MDATSSGFQRRGYEIQLSFVTSKLARERYTAAKGESAPHRVSYTIMGYSLDTNVLPLFIEQPESPVQKYDFNLEVDFCEPVKQPREKLVMFAIKGIRAYRRNQLYAEARQNYMNAVQELRKNNTQQLEELAKLERRVTKGHDENREHIALWSYFGIEPTLCVEDVETVFFGIPETATARYVRYSSAS